MLGALLKSRMSLPIMGVNQDMSLDGWGSPFPPHSQLYHWQAIKAALEQHERDKAIPIPQPEQVPWKELPAGTWDKSLKADQRLDS